MTPQELLNYYSSLLILQYVGKPNATATVQTFVNNVLLPQVTVQTIAFSPAPTAGHWYFTWNGLTTTELAWNSSASAIQTAIQLLAGLSAATVTGSIASGLLTVTFTGVLPIAPAITVTTNTLTASAGSVIVTPVVAETDVLLPIAAQNAFNLIGPNPAVGAQLDILGKYAGITRVGYGLNGSIITLDDADFLAFILMTIVKNTAGSSLYTIQQYLSQYFMDALLVFDYQDMRMSYFLNSNIGSQQLAQMFVTSNTLPVPMGVQIGTIIYTPYVTSLFGFRTYENVAYNVSPFNTYADYILTYPWLSYTMALT